MGSCTVCSALVGLLYRLLCPGGLLFCPGLRFRSGSLLRLGSLLCPGFLLRRFCLGVLLGRLSLSPRSSRFHMDLALRPSPCSASAPPPSWIVLRLERLEAAPWGGGYVTNPGHELLFTHHQRSLLHHIDFHTTQTVAYHPKTTFPIIHCTDDTHTTDCTDHTQLIPICTLFISLGLSLCDRRVLYAHIATLADSYLTEPFVVVIIVLPC